MTEYTQDDITCTPLFKKLLAEAPRFEKEHKAFKQKYQELWDTDHKRTVIVLECHLIIEAFLTDYLEHANPAASRIGDTRLSFSQKLDLSYHPQTNFAFFYNGIKALNTLRNKYAHRHGYTITEGDVAPMKYALKILKDASKEAMPEGFEIIPMFTEFVCAYIDGTVQSIKRHGGNAGLPGLLSWYSDCKTVDPEDGEE